jgi:hypothetical protein
MVGALIGGEDDYGEEDDEYGAEYAGKGAKGKKVKEEEYDFM